MKPKAPLNPPHPGWHPQQSRGGRAAAAERGHRIAPAPRGPWSCMAGNTDDPAQSPRTQAQQAASLIQPEKERQQGRQQAAQAAAVRSRSTSIHTGGQRSTVRLASHRMRCTRAASMARRAALMHRDTRAGRCSANWKVCLQEGQRCSRQREKRTTRNDKEHDVLEKGPLLLANLHFIKTIKATKHQGQAGLPIKPTCPSSPAQPAAAAPSSSQAHASAAPARRPQLRRQPAPLPPAGLTAAAALSMPLPGAPR